MWTPLWKARLCHASYITIEVSRERSLLHHKYIQHLTSIANYIVPSFVVFLENSLPALYMYHHGSYELNTARTRLPRTQNHQASIQVSAATTRYTRALSHLSKPRHSTARRPSIQRHRGMMIHSPSLFTSTSPVLIPQLPRPTNRNLD